MCGIAGLWSTALRAERAREVVAAMTNAVVHRGPDAEGLWQDPLTPLTLGHRRLAVVGLGEAGAQPMASRSGRWVVTYNGELYGTEALRAAVGEQVALRGTSDTELLVEALDRWGPAGALERLEGMFAFAAWDRDEQRLVLARDRMGEKPLVYGPVPGGIAFASELGALRQVPGFDDRTDPAAVALYLRYKAVPAPWTIHPGTRKLPPGCWLELRAPSAPPPEPQTYWSHAEVVERGLVEGRRPATAASLDELDAVVRSAVTRQLRADVPLGAFLSGGIDSSLVVTLASEVAAEPLRTFTIGSPSADLDEADDAAAVAARLGTDHTTLVVRPEDALAEVPTLAGRWDEPFGDSSALPTLLVSRLARASVTVALSGDGGDELFGGYNRHTWLPRVWDRTGRVPVPARRLAGTALGRPSPEVWDRLAGVLPANRRPRLVGLKVQKLAGVLAATSAPEAYLRAVSHWTEPGVLAGAAEPAVFASQSGRWPAAGHLVEQLMAVDARTYLADDVLVKADRAAMSVALETRVPLLDRQVVEVAARLPADHRVRGGVGKWALRELLARRHPRDLFERPKSGFGVPIAEWLRGPLRPWAEDLLSPGQLARAPLAETGPIRAAWEEHRRGRADRSYELWDVLMLVAWSEQTRSGDSRHPVPGR